MFIPTSFNKELHNDLIYRYLTEEYDVNLFLDTNVLIWLLEINNDAFGEFIKFLSNRAIEGKLIIPNWVIFEFNNYLNEKQPHLFVPIYFCVEPYFQTKNHF